ncbi:hypothetical protein ACQKE0_12585 [Shewanella colwelliana]|uniref:hypothetical protein n=1 Tax=Shewanella colwelliana TaxID=23 RepID=UPI003CFCBE45
MKNQTLTAMLIILFALLSGCQSTAKKQAIPLNKSEHTGQLSSLAFIHQQGQLIAESLEKDSTSAAFNWWNRATLLTYAHNTYPDLTDAEEESFYRFVRTKFKNQVKQAQYWRFDGVQGDNLVLSTYISDMPAAILLNYQYSEVAGHQQLRIVDWQLVHHLTSGLDAYFAYLHNADAIANSGFIKVIQSARAGQAMDEQQVAAIFDKLPDSIKTEPTLLTDFIWSSFVTIDEPSTAIIDTMYQFAPMLTPKNSAFWGYSYMYKNEMSQYQYTRELAMANLNNLQTNYAMVGVLYALQQNEVEYAQQEFMRYIQSQPHDAMAYAIYLNNLIDLGLHQQASDIFQAFNLQFDVKLNQQDFAESDQQKVAAFFNSPAFKQISQL